MDKLFNQIGGFGRFQLFAVITIVLGLSGPNWFWYEVGYLDQAPDSYVCTYDPTVAVAD